ncbi:uncharacterized protein [Lepeophtheirus salmonis]|uniref:uncharacterized protein n=1 Tax=Lepeophtheirus salmonis TaxID=72036 RepID=UPI001AEA66EB|nr:uncharacterized protein LOC121118643 [Lepeophtheirus salmonis]
MNCLLSGIVLTTLFIVYELHAKTISPNPYMNHDNEVFSPIPIHGAVLTIADSVLEEIKPYYGILGHECELTLDHIYHAESSISQEIKFKLDLKISSIGTHCIEETKTCIGVTVLVIPIDICSESYQPCFKLIDRDNILCIPDLSVHRYEDFNFYTEILDPSSNPMIQKVAQESTNFLYHFFNTTHPCPLHVTNILHASEQMDHGINYLLDIEVETNEIDFYCEHEVKHCKSVQLHQPSPHLCPYGKHFCLIPTNLNDVTCI